MARRSVPVARRPDPHRESSSRAGAERFASPSGPTEDELTGSEAAGNPNSTWSFAGTGVDPRVKGSRRVATGTTRHQTGLPARLESGVEALSGVSLDDVRVHYNSPQPARFEASAFTQGADIHIGEGQEQHVAHEAWHVVQQKQGRVKPTLSMNGAALDVNDVLEREADVMGSRAQQGPTVEAPVPIAAPTTIAAPNAPIQRVRCGVCQEEKDAAGGCACKKDEFAQFAAPQAPIGGTPGTNPDMTADAESQIRALMAGLTGRTPVPNSPETSPVLGRKKHGRKSL